MRRCGASDACDACSLRLLALSRSEECIGVNFSPPTQDADRASENSTGPFPVFLKNRLCSSGCPLFSNTAPDRVDTFFRTEQPVTIIRANLKVRAAVIAIPETPVSWDFRAFIAQVEQIEQAEQVIVKIVPTPGLK